MHVLKFSLCYYCDCVVDAHNSESDPLIDSTSPALSVSRHLSVSGLPALSSAHASPRSTAQFNSPAGAAARLPKLSAIHSPLAAIPVTATSSHDDPDEERMCMVLHFPTPEELK